MGKKVFYAFLSVGFFAILLVGIIMFTDLLFNSSSSFFDRMTDVSDIYKGLGK